MRLATGDMGAFLRPPCLAASGRPCLGALRARVPRGPRPSRPLATGVRFATGDVGLPLRTLWQAAPGGACTGVPPTACDGPRADRRLQLERVPWAGRPQICARHRRCALVSIGWRGHGLAWARDPLEFMCGEKVLVLVLVLVVVVVVVVLLLLCLSLDSRHLTTACSAVCSVSACFERQDH